MPLRLNELGSSRQRVSDMESERQRAARDAEELRNQVGLNEGAAFFCGS